MKLDEALTLVGAYGRYQLLIFTVIAVFDNFPSIMHMSIMTFIGFEPPHRCKVDSLRVYCALRSPRNRPAVLLADTS